MVLAWFTAASAATNAATFTGKGGMARRRRLNDGAWASTAPSRRPASPAVFEKVRVTNSCGYLLIQETTETPENSAYASSITTAVSELVCKIFLISAGCTRVPVGLLGFAMNNT